MKHRGFGATPPEYTKSGGYSAGTAGGSGEGPPRARLLPVPFREQGDAPQAGPSTLISGTAVGHRLAPRVTVFLGSGPQNDVFWGTERRRWQRQRGRGRQRRAVP